MIPGELYIFGLIAGLVLVLLGMRYATSKEMNKGLFGFVCLVSSYIMLGSMAYVSLDTICFSYGNFVLDPCIGKYIALISFVICIFSLVFYILSNVVFLYMIPSILDKMYNMFNGYNEEALTYIIETIMIICTAISLLMLTVIISILFM